MSGQRPTYRLIVKDGEGQAAAWKELGACWKLANSENFSVRLELADGPLKCLMVPNKPRPSQSVNDRAANGNRSEPTRGPQRTRKPGNDRDVA